MVAVRSVSTWTSSAAGSVLCSCGSSSLMPSTTAMTLAPGWRWTFRMTAGVRLAQAASWSSCGARDHAGRRRDRCTGRAVLVGEHEVVRSPAAR